MTDMVPGRPKSLWLHCRLQSLWPHHSCTCEFAGEGCNWVLLREPKQDSMTLASSQGNVGGYVNLKAPASESQKSMLPKVFFNLQNGSCLEALGSYRRHFLRVLGCDSFEFDFSTHRRRLGDWGNFKSPTGPIGVEFDS